MAAGGPDPLLVPSIAQNIEATALRSSRSQTGGASRSSRGQVRFLIWGAGGHGRVVAELVRALGGVVVGFIDADRRKLGGAVDPAGARVELTEDDFLNMFNAGTLPMEIDGLALGIGGNGARLECLRSIADFPVPPLVHPAAVVSDSSTIGRGTVVMAGSVINAAAQVGEGVIINTGAIVEHDCVVAEGAHLSPGCVLAGTVRVGAGSWIGASATVLPGVEVGAWSTVGAGSVVLDDVPHGVTVAGVPARAIRMRTES